MPSQYKYFELYSVGCFTAKTESLAVSYGFGSLLMNTFLFLASLQSEPLWGVGPAALFHMFAALALFYAGWADSPSCCWLFLVINGVTITAMALAFFAALLLDLNPQLLSQIKDQFGGGRGDPQQMNNSSAVQNELRQLELALLLLMALQWMAQGLVWHYYQYLKHRSVEQFGGDRRAPPALHPRCGSVRISPVKRLQLGGFQNGK